MQIIKSEHSRQSERETINHDSYLPKSFRWLAKSHQLAALCVLLGAGSSLAQTSTPISSSMSPNGGPGSLTNVFGILFDQIQRSEYEIHWQSAVGSFMTPNRAQNLRFKFLDDGLTVTPRELQTSDMPWQLTMRLTSFGSSDLIPQT